MGLWHLKRGEFSTAEKFFRQAVERLTRRNANPYDGEAYYNLGLCLRYLGRDDEAYDALYKACWNQAWQSAAYHALAEIDCCRQDWHSALEHLNHSLRFNTDNLRARNLKVVVLGELQCDDAAEALLRETLILDPLDWWARVLTDGHQNLTCDLQTRLDLAHDYSRAGFFRAAIELLASAKADACNLPDQNWGAWPLVHYTLGWLHQKLGDQKSALASFKTAAKLPPDYCFPARLEEIAILEAAMQANPRDAKAPYYLGNLFYDRRRHAEAIQVWRNLGIGYFNILKKPAKARAAYAQALRVNPGDARLLFERDQLWKRLGESPAKRLRELEKFPQLVAKRDDLTVEFCALLNQTGRHGEAMQLLAHRNFQPWEGGESAALGQHIRAQLALGREALKKAESEKRKAEIEAAVAHFESALTAPRNLGEAKHLLANQSDIHYWLGVALDLLGEKKSAREHWRAAANFKGDFQEMSVRAFSELTYYSALSLAKLGQKSKAKKLLRDLLCHANELAKTTAKIEYFATSLPTMLLFDDDGQFRQETTALFLRAQAKLGLGRIAHARALLKAVLQRDPSHALATDLAQPQRPPTNEITLKP